jgi:hypothetical protein
LCRLWTARPRPQRPVGVQDDGTGSGEQHEAGDADEAGVHEAGTDRDAGQHRRESEQWQREQGGRVDERDDGKAADGSVGVKPAAESMSNWRAALAADPPGRMPLTAFPVRPAVTTANHALVRSATRCRPK